MRGFLAFKGELYRCRCSDYSAGYGFVDFDSPTSAQKAVTALKAGGVQAQMAKVRTPRGIVCLWSLVDLINSDSILALEVCVDGSTGSLYLFRRSLLQI